MTLLEHCVVVENAMEKETEMWFIQLHFSFQPTGEGGCGGGVSGGHSVWLPEGPCGECVSQSHWFFWTFYGDN